jgi:hypothetical protein
LIALTDLQVHDEPAVAIEDAAKKEESHSDVNICDIDVPVLMRPQWLLEATPLLGRCSQTGSEFAGRLEDTVDAGGTDGHHVGVEHHVRQSSISFQGVEVTERHDWDRSAVLDQF